MGSWNATCGVSGLPIRSNEEVRLFILENAHAAPIPESEGVIHSDELFAPVSMAIPATYDDCGRFILKKDAAGNVPEWVGYYLGVLQVTGLIDPPAKASIDEVWDVFSESVRNAATHAGTENAAGAVRRIQKRFFLFPVREALYGALVEKMRADEWIRHRLQTRVRAANEVFSVFGNTSSETDVSSRAAKEFLRSDVAHIHSVMFWGSVAEALAKKKGNATLDDLPPEAVDFVLFRYAMEGLRRAFMPMTGVGHFDEHLDLHAAVAAETQKVVAEANEELEEDEVAPARPRL